MQRTALTLRTRAGRHGAALTRPSRKSNIASSSALATARSGPWSIWCSSSRTLATTLHVGDTPWGRGVAEVRDEGLTLRALAEPAAR